MTEPKELATIEGWKLTRGREINKAEAHRPRPGDRVEVWRDREAVIVDHIDRHICTRIPLTVLRAVMGQEIPGARRTPDPLPLEVLERDRAAEAERLRQYLNVEPKEDPND